jgi:hypothetical protein
MSRMHGMTRREFMRHSMSTAVVAPAVAGLGVEAFQSRPQRTSVVTLVRDEKAVNGSRDVDPSVLGRMLDETVARSTGEQSPRAAWRSLFRSDDVVGIVSTTAVIPTHPELIEAVRQRLVENVGIPRERIREAQRSIEAAKASTALISLPALKAHWLTGIGTVIKNYIMFSGEPSRYHDANSVNLAEVWTLPAVAGKTRLVLVDALRPLCDKGPQPDPRYMWDYRGLIAGTDPVAVETIALRIITEKRRALQGEPWPLSPPPLCVAAADQKFHLGTSRMEEIKLQRVGWEGDVLV